MNTPNVVRRVESAAQRMSEKKIWVIALILILTFVAPLRATVYLTADDLNGTNLFGTLDPATGKFTLITQTDPLFLALTAGPSGRLYGADANSQGLFTISSAGASTPFGTVTAPATFYGLAYSTGHFFADNLDEMAVTLYSISGHGNSSSSVGQLAGPNSGFFPTGNLVFGPGGKLYFDFIPSNSLDSILYSVNTGNGALTQIGIGLGTDILALFSDGNTLYGVDADATSNQGIFRVDTATGLATQISTLNGLPANESGFFVDAVAVSTPDTGSTFALFILALVLLRGGTRLCRRVATAA